MTQTFLAQAMNVSMSKKPAVTEIISFGNVCICWKRLRHNRLDKHKGWGQGEEEQETGKTTQLWQKLKL